MYRLIVALASGIAAVLGGASPLWADLRETFFREAPLAWNKIREGPPYFQGTVIETCTGVRGLAPSESYRQKHEFAFSDGRVLHRATVLEGTPVLDRVSVINPDYAFRLARTSDGSAWDVRHVGGEWTVRDRMAKTADCIYISTYVDNEPLPWLVREPGFNVQQARDVSKDGTKLVEIKFTSTAVLRPDYVVTGGTITFDVDRLWAVRDYHVNIRLDIAGTVEGHIDYDPARPSYPVPVRAVKDQKFRGGEVHRHFELEFPRFEEAKAPDSAFRLTAFGLPEPMPRRGGNLWLIALVVAACCFVAVLVLWRMRAASE